MWDWLFPPRCPCDPAAKEWVEESLAKLVREFPDNVFTAARAVVVPTLEFFPDPYGHTVDAAEVLFDRVCDYMDVDPKSVELEFFHEENKLGLINQQGHALPTAGGTFQEGGLRNYRIRIETDELGDGPALAGTMAHELAHARLIGEERVYGDEYDNELLTDLLAVVLGMGVFNASSPRNWRSQYSKWPGTDLNKPEYLTPPMYGYALGHLAWVQGERKPAWLRYVRGDSRGFTKAAIRYLFKTGGTTFRPPRLA